MTIKTLSEDNTEDIYSVERACFSKPWDKSVIVGTISQSSYRYFGAFDGDIMCAYASVTLVAGECYVNRIAVLEGYRRRGVADKIMKSIIAFCKESNAAFVSLEVRSKNIAAIRLYKKHGLKRDGVRRNYYNDPVDDADIMTLNFM